MFCIVAHHYVVNSGIIKEITPEKAVSARSLFALIFGWGGKTGINCFVLITGYFMCRSTISLRKFLKLLLEIEFYKIVVWLIFLLSGYTSFTFKSTLKAILPIYGIGTGFIGSYLCFFLFIPYLNLLIYAMNEQQHQILIGLCIGIGTVLQTFLKAPAAFTYVGWFMVCYLIAAYIRIYPNELFDNSKVWRNATWICLFFSWCSVVFGALIYHKYGKAVYYYFVSDSNKLLAIMTAVSAFLFFKNMKMKYHPVINKVAASTFGVLMIHANSDTMRQWLWRDVLKNTSAFHNSFFVIHAFGSVLAVYCICTVIDMVRIVVFEKPFFKWFDRRKLGLKGIQS